jgi:hypothetical protein
VATPTSRREGGGRGCPAGTGRRRHRGEGEAAESEDRYATPDLLLKHPDATLATYILRQMKHMKHASETLAKTAEKTLENHCKTYAASR